jgi:hypothetical protein
LNQAGGGIEYQAGSWSWSFWSSSPRRLNTTSAASSCPFQ